MSQDILAIPGAGCCPMPSDREAQSDIYLTSANETLTPELRAELRSVEASVQQLNASVQRAMKAGVIIELRRRHRVHSGDGCWADQMAPLVQARQREL
jgi:hypothetical protein